MLDLSKIKEDFSSLVLDAQPWTLAQFVMWLDLKLSEYKIKGYMVLDYQKKTKPRWLSQLGDDSDPDSDTAPQPPPCRNCHKGAGTEHTHHERHYSQSGSSERFTTVDGSYPDNVPDTNRCIVDLSKEPMAADTGKSGGKPKEKVSNLIQIDDDNTGIGDSRVSSKSAGSDLIEIESSDINSSVTSSILRPTSNSQPHPKSSFIQSPRKSLHPNLFPSSIGVKVTGAHTVSKLPPPDRRQQTSSATITHPTQSSMSTVFPPSQTFSSPGFFQQQTPGIPSSAMQHMLGDTLSSPSYSSTSEPPLSRPVPVALHTSFDPPGGQRIYPPGEAIGEHNSTHSDSVTEIKQEFDISNLHLMTGFEDEMNPNTSVSDNSHMSLSDDEIGRNKDSWSMGANTSLHSVRAISEQAKQIELPKFEDLLVRRVLEDTAPPTRHMWSKIITRCANHMLSKGVPHKHDYQLFSEAFYYRYPCIGTTRGPNPWRYFAARLSQKIRNDRRGFKKKISFLSTGGALRKPLERPPKLDSGLKLSGATSFVRHSLPGINSSAGFASVSKSEAGLHSSGEIRLSEAGLNSSADMSIFRHSETGINSRSEIRLSEAGLNSSADLSVFRHSDSGINSSGDLSVLRHSDARLISSSDSSILRHSEVGLNTSSELPVLRHSDVGLNSSNVSLPLPHQK